MEREDPRDVLLSNGGTPLEDLAPGARIGTSSLRRRALIRRWRRALELVDLRGNVSTRIHKLSEGRFDAIVLAAAGVKRLNFESRITAYLPLERVLPAVAQGAVVLQVREDDEYVLSWVRQLDDADTRQATAAERALLGRLEGGCQVPVGALATVTNGVLTLRAVVSSLDFAAFVEYASGSQSQYAGYWRCVGTVLLCEAYTLACFAAVPACYVACVGICGSPGVLLCLSCILACSGGGLAICQLAFNCWQQASRNGCVPW